MSTTAETKTSVSCTFCSKTNKDVKKIIAGPGVYICDECIRLCNTIIEGEATEPAAERAPSLDDAPVDQLVIIFGAMARTARSMDDRLGEWARRLAERGVPTSTIAAEAGLTDGEASERFNL